MVLYLQATAYGGYQQMVTQEEARLAADDLSKVYLNLEPYKQHISCIVAIELKTMRRVWPIGELDDWCVMIGLESPLPEPFSFSLRHNGVRVVTVDCKLPAYA